MEKSYQSSGVALVLNRETTPSLASLFRALLLVKPYSSNRQKQERGTRPGLVPLVSWSMKRAPGDDGDT